MRRTGCAHQPELSYREVLVEVIGWSLGSPKVSGRRVLSCMDRHHFGLPTQVYVQLATRTATQWSSETLGKGAQFTFSKRGPLQNSDPSTANLKFEMMGLWL